jgi:ring-1,2-phenylacetyl-CoA epoxidase subunit PaaD
MMAAESIVDERDVWRALEKVEDPELPIGIVDLGIVDAVTMDRDGHVVVDLIPTFSGCPALEVIRERVIDSLQELGVANAEVRWKLGPAWDPGRISSAGRAQLREHGITGGDPAAAAAASGARCPFCNSEDTERASGFGPALCRVVYRCRCCRNIF